MENNIDNQIIKHKNELLIKMNELIIGERKRFIEQYRDKQSIKYCTQYKPLIDKVVLAHLEGKRTIGCYYLGSHSKFLCFDVDSNNVEVLISLVSILKTAGFLEEDLHIEKSGLKGWHVWIFISEKVNIRPLVEFGKLIVNMLPNNGKFIELRPECSQKSRGIKIPFAVHLKSSERTVFVNHNLIEFSDNIGYFLNIKQTNANRLLGIINNFMNKHSTKSKVDKNEKKSIKDKQDGKKSNKGRKNKNNVSLVKLAERIRELGIPMENFDSSKRRHYYQFHLILYYKGKGYSEDKTSDLVIKWALQEKLYNRVKSSEDEIINDVKNDVKHIYLKDKKFYSSRQYKLPLRKSDFKLFDSYYDYATKKIVMSLIVIGRVFHIDGHFFCSIRQIEQMTGLNKNTVHRRIRELIKSQFLLLIETGKFNGPNSKASLYYLPYLIKTDNSKKMNVPTKSTEWKEMLNELVRFIDKNNHRDIKV